jgi:exodeoxyribonuclease-5
MKKLQLNQLRLFNNKIITFNEQQVEAITLILAWLRTPGKKFFTLAGYAGTGKTVCMRKIVELFQGGFVVSAPTHKAKLVIENATGYPGKTLHSLLGLRPDLELENFNPNDPIFNPIAPSQLNDYNLIIIDEASMVNKDLFEMINEKIVDVKILFIGDPAQCPPVNEKESVVFDIEDSYWLTKIERQADTNPLLIVSEQLRNNLTVPDGAITRKTVLNEYGDGIIFTCNKEQFREELISRFKAEEYKTDVNFVKLIAWRNSTVMASNQIIRAELFGENADLIEVGELLMAYRTITTEKFVPIITNSVDYRVLSKMKIEKNEYEISGYSVEIRDELTKSHPKKKIFIVDSRDESNLHDYAELHDKYRFIASLDKREWKKYYEFRRKNMIMVTIDKYRDGTYRKKGDIIAKDLDYGNAITCHKAQGSTYKYCFTIEEDINENRLIKERNQLKYVTITRPTRVAHVLTTKIDI